MCVWLVVCVCLCVLYEWKWRHIEMDEMCFWVRPLEACRTGSGRRRRRRRQAEGAANGKATHSATNNCCKMAQAKHTHTQTHSQTHTNRHTHTYINTIKCNYKASKLSGPSRRAGVIKWKWKMENATGKGLCQPTRKQQWHKPQAEPATERQQLRQQRQLGCGLAQFSSRATWIEWQPEYVWITCRYPALIGRGYMLLKLKEAEEMP